MDSLHESCAALFEEEHVVKVDEESIRKYAATLKQPFEADVKHTLPFKFDNTEQELNFVALYNLLSFGSGYDKELQAQGREDAHSTTLFAVIALFLSGQKLDAATMLNMRTSDMVQLMDIHTHEEVESELKGTTLMKPTILLEFVELVTSTLNDTGRILQSRGMTSLAAFILDVTKPSAADKCTAGKLVEALANVFPAFEDTDAYGNKALAFHSKAQHLVFDLYMRFSETDAARFDFEDIGQLSVSADMLAVSVLRKLNIIKLTDLEAAKVIDETRQHHVLDPLLRAAAVKAVRDFCVVMNTEHGWAINARDVDYELRKLAALPEFSDMHVIRRTGIVQY
eukprot:m.103852 g.103852  ORF g.103852 m.103852 type:complete len:340 (-) comp15731_c0_seq1:3336-4355(-)